MAGDYLHGLVLEKKWIASISLNYIRLETGTLGHLLHSYTRSFQRRREQMRYAQT